MELAVPLTDEQVNCACQVHDQLSQWRLSESALAQLALKFPAFSSESCLLKTVAVNSIYGTNLLAAFRMAQHIEAVLANPLLVVDIALVEKIAKLPAHSEKKERMSVSFASKFCHFFVDAETFPIYDESARDAMALHGGEGCRVVDKSNPYATFCENFNRLRSEAELKCTTRQLDHYLWLLGMYLRWLKERSRAQPRVNAELLQQFKNPARKFAGLFQAMLPKHLAETFSAAL
jgi:hypothetical protein